MATGSEILAVAAREIGYHEGKGKHNKYGEWYGMDCVPWCVEFVDWVYAQADVHGPKLGLKKNEGGTASCGELLNWYKKNQPDCISDHGVPGCPVIFDFPNTKYATDHIGIFVKLDGKRIVTIDGNTSADNNSNGGWVQQRRRNLSYANPVYIIPRELEEDVKRYQTLDEIKAEAPWAAPTIQKLMKAGALNGDGNGLDLSYDMLREFVVNDRMGVYGRG